MKNTERIMYYVLDADHNPVPVDDAETWAKMFEDITQRRVAFDKIGQYEVSTVFIGLDHSFVSDVPILFETMVFGGDSENEMDRYATWDEAVAGHKAMVEKVKSWKKKKKK